MPAVKTPCFAVRQRKRIKMHTWTKAEIGPDGIRLSGCPAKAEKTEEIRRAENLKRTETTENRKRETESRENGRNRASGTQSWNSDRKQQKSRPVEGIIAVSGGPDSMSLLAQLTSHGRRLAAAHVNYHARETAGRDEKIVREFCVQHHLPFHKIDVHYDPSFGNFQAWARDVRYQFFEDLARKYHVQVLYTGHQLDDHIETYLMQKERDSIPECYGMEPESQRGELRIRRPLLNWSKKRCEDWNAEHGIVWGLDESNLQDKYRRNQIRHSVIDNMSEADKIRLKEEIAQANQDLKKRKQRANQMLKDCPYSEEVETVNYQQILEDEDAWFILEQLIYSSTGIHHGRKELLDWAEQLKSGYACFLLRDRAGKPWVLESYRHILTLLRRPVPVYFKADSAEDLIAAVNQPAKDSFIWAGWADEVLSEQQEDCAQILSLDGFVWLQPEDFPVTIRTARETDVISMRFGRKKLNRFFIDRKMNAVQRARCFVAENCKGQVIFVSGLGCDRNHFKKGTGIVLSRPVDGLM